MRKFHLDLDLDQAALLERIVMARLRVAIRRVELPGEPAGIKELEDEIAASLRAILCLLEDSIRLDAPPSKDAR